MTKSNARPKAIWSEEVGRGDEPFVRMTSAEFALFYRDHQTLVRSVAYQMTGDAGDLDEIVQQSFIKIWKNVATFRNEAKITSWIYRLTMNTALDYLRHRSRQTRLKSEVEQLETVASATPESSSANRDLVLKGLMSLSADHRTVLVLAFLHELPLSEVADVLELSEGTVKSRLHYAKAAFREFMAKRGVNL